MKLYEENFIVCNDVNKLIELVKTSRQVNDQVHLKFGIDGGGGFLKICLSIQLLNENGIENNSRKRQTYDEGVTAKKMKDSGVKKLFFIGLANSA